MKVSIHRLLSLMGMTSIMLIGLGGFPDDEDDFDYEDDAYDEDDEGVFNFVLESLSASMNASHEAKKWDLLYGSDPVEKGRNQDNAIRYSKVCRLPDEDLRKIRNKAFLLKHKRITIGYCCEDLLGLNVNSVATKLHNKAFTRISKIPIKRMRFGTADKPGSVKQIVIGRNTFFQDTDTFPYDTHIKLYFCNGNIKLPLSSKQLGTMNYKEACAYLEELGFVNIKVKPKNDLVLGLLHSEGDIDKISIDGNCDFRKNKSFSFDDAIIIEYHCHK